MAADVQEQDLREEATQRLRKRRDFAAHVAAYVLVNVSIVAIWAMTGSGFFWPVFLILGWGIGLFFHGWDTFARPLSERRIEDEMDRLRHIRSDR
jgi:2TM domain-containing protein